MRYISALSATRADSRIRELFERKSKEDMAGKKLITTFARKQHNIIWAVWTKNREYS